MINTSVKMVREWLAGQKKSVRRSLLFLTVLVTFYIVFLLWLLPEMMEAVPMDTKYWKIKIAAALLMLFPVFAGLLWAAYRCSFIRPWLGSGKPLLEGESFWKPETEKARKDRRTLCLWFLFGFGLVFILMMVYFYAFFPGSFDWDTQDQWWQIQNHQYDTWHPVFHTLLIAFFSKFVNHYGFAVFMQLFLYSLLCGYLIATMARWRFPAWSLVLTEFFLAANPQTHRILLFMWKDCALTLFMLLFTVYVINVWMSRGAWLKKWRNLAAWSLVLISVSMVRHNGILYTLPLLVMSILFFKEIRRESMVSLVFMFAGILVIKYPVYDLVGAGRVDQTYVETVGVPMTILCNIHETAPQSLDPGAAGFLASIGPEKRWQIYEMGNYNSFKFVTNANEVIKYETTPKEFLGFTARTVRNAPGLALQAFYQVTRMAWDIRGDTPWHGDLEFQLMGNEWNYAYVESRASLREALNDFDEWVIDTPFNLLFSYNGLYLLALILSTLLVFAREGKGWRAMCISVPILAYSLGTMLLLCGPTYRFFHFDSVIFMPLCLLLFAETNQRG